MADAAEISTVFLDLDETICEQPRSTADRLGDAFDCVGVDPFFTVTDFRRWLPKVNAESELDLRKQCFGGIAREQNRDPSLADELAGAYEDPNPENVRFLPGAESALKSLADTYDLALVTNGGREVQRTKLDALDIADVFDVTVFAEPGKPVKPDPEPFDRALSAIGGSIETTIHVGNSLRSDVAGAQAAGIEAVWVAHTEETASVTPEYVIESMAELRRPPWIQPSHSSKER